VIGSERNQRPREFADGHVKPPCPCHPKRSAAQSKNPRLVFWREVGNPRTHARGA
jgi:hypothetical protein